MTVRYLAGHPMDDGLHGLVCTLCGRTWLQMLAEREHWRKGELGIAHVAGLSDNEVGELRAELDRLWASVKAAVEA
jgi:hypothetical protein